MTKKRTWQVENTWACSSCSAKNLGRHMVCQNCGAPKDGRTKDTVGDASKAVVDPELLKLANQKANWVCEYCGGQVRDEHGKCARNCGAPRPAAPQTPVRASARAPVPVTDFPRPPLASVVPEPPAPNRRLFQALLFVGSLALIGGLVFLLMPRELEAEVVSIEWRHSAQLFQRELKQGENWKGRMPSGTFNVSCVDKYYGDEDCNPHDCRPHNVSYDCNCTSYECNCRTTCRDNGNGFSSCSESCGTCSRCETCSRTEYDTCYDSCPVNKPWCVYSVYEWPLVRSLAMTGSKHDESWPDLAAVGETQRLDRSASYVVVFARVAAGRVDTQAERWTLRARSLDEFKGFSVGNRWLIKAPRFTSTPEPLKRLP